MGSTVTRGVAPMSTEWSHTEPVQDMTPATGPAPADGPGWQATARPGPGSPTTLGEAQAAVQAAAADPRGVRATVVSGDLSDPTVAEDLRAQLVRQVDQLQAD